MGMGGNSSSTGAIEVVSYVDSLVVPVSFFLGLGYHAYLWHTFKHNPLLTSIGVSSLNRRSWLRLLNQGDDKKGMLAVQSLRNTLMYTILTATITILITLALAALTNNAFNAHHLLVASPTLFGSQSPRIIILKYGSASIFLLASFLCSSMALALLIDANFLINAIGEFCPAPGYTEVVVERGFALSLVGNRMLCIAFPLLLWMFGPLAVAASTAALVWVLYGMDFNSYNNNNRTALGGSGGGGV